jgi:lysophospholipase L1-like esterase
MSRNLFEYHPVFGYRFIPGLRARVRHEGGGYLVRCNQAGFRCDHEATPRRQPGCTRVLLFGDSYTAGEGVSNRFRFGDLLERRLPGLEVLNFGLPGSGTDQQYLAFRECARDLDHDLLLLCPMVENVRRNLDTHRLTQRASDGRLVLRAKPYFRLAPDGGLELRHQPVPKEILPADAQAAPPAGPATRRALRRLGARIDRRLPGFVGLSRRLRGVRWPAEYESPDHPGWRLMRAILARWIAESRAPVLLCPLPTSEHVRKEIRADGYRARFAELGRDTGVPVADVLPALWRHPARVRRAARFPSDDHPSRLGHALLADALAPLVARHAGLAGAEAA